MFIVYLFLYILHPLDHILYPLDHILHPLDHILHPLDHILHHLDSFRPFKPVQRMAFVCDQLWLVWTLVKINKYTIFFCALKDTYFQAF